MKEIFAIDDMVREFKLEFTTFKEKVISLLVREQERSCQS